MIDRFIDIKQFSIFQKQRITSYNTSFSVFLKDDANPQSASFQNKSYKKQYYSAIIIDEEINLNNEEQIFEVAQAWRFHLNNPHPALLPVYGISPIDFDSDYRLSAITFSQESTLEDLLNQERKGLSPFDNDLGLTQKLIILYGIACGMSFLHLHSINHQSLNPYTVFIDQSLHPHILLNQIYNENPKAFPYFGIQYLSPEVLSGDTATAASDVYSFGILAYELLTTFVPFERKDITTLINSIINGSRPKWDFPIGDSLTQLIEDCWVKDPSQRPSFEDILSRFKNDFELLSDIDDVLFYDYVDFLENSPTQNAFSEIDQFKFINIQDFQQEGNSSIVSQYITSLKQVLLNGNSFLLPNRWFTDLERINIGQKMDQSSTMDRYKGLERASHQPLSLQIFRNEITPESNQIFNDLNRILNIHMKLYHPAIIALYGFSPIDYNYSFKPIIFTKFYSVGSLERIINLTHQTVIQELDDIEKFIIIYGICEGMSYLHNNSIVHSNLNSHNILLTDQNYPLIKNFCNSEILPNDSQLSITRKKFDVFSFGLIAYELLNNKLISNPNIEDIQQKIASNEIPEFEYPIPSAYEQLIRNCLSLDETKRPTFSEILTYLKTDPYFTDSLESKEFLQYNKYYTQHGIKFIPKNIQFDYDDFIEFQKKYLNKIKITEPRMDHQNLVEDYFHKLQTPFIDLTNFLVIQEAPKYSQILDKSTGAIYALRSHKYQNIPNETDLLKLNRAINIAQKLIHPGIVKFVGLSPVDFSNQLGSVIADEYCSNGTLKAIIDLESNGLSPDNWDGTQKLIVLYGIANAMAFLHKHGIVYRNLKPSNVFLNDSFYPLIGDFAVAKFYSLKRKISDKSSGITGTAYYIAPEILKSPQYSEATDVYAFAITAYEIITNLCPYKTQNLNIYQFLNLVAQGNRPSFVKGIPKLYQELIEECWSADPSKRPTFEAICKRLEDEEDFLQEIDIDISRFDAYKAYLNKSEIYYKKSNCYFSLDDLKEFQENNRDHSLKKSADDTYETVMQRFAKKEVHEEKKAEKDDKQSQPKTASIDSHDLSQLDYSEMFTNLSDFVKIRSIGGGQFGEVFEVWEKATSKSYAVKISYMNLRSDIDTEMLNINREVRALRSFRHAAILRFIGFSPVDFNNDMHPAIITDYHKYGALSSFLHNSKLIQLPEKLRPKWDDTQKLIVLYGIASGMAFLHKNNCLHRDLKPANILMNDDLCPVIGDFGLAKLNSQDRDASQSILGLKGSPLYMPPEVFKTFEYSPTGDIYAFAIIAYELITDLVPFEGLNVAQIRRKVLDNQRPDIPEGFNKPHYIDLINRCWAPKSESRPTFSEIVDQLENDPNFRQGIDESRYLNYIKSVNEYGEQFNSSNEKYKFEDFIDFKKQNLSDSSYEEEEEPDVSQHKVIESRASSKSDSDISSPQCLQMIYEATGNKEKMLQVGLSIYQGINGFIQNKEFGNQYIKNSADLDCIEACILYAKNMKLENKLKETAAYYEKAANLGSEVGQYKYGKMLCEGKCINQDMEKGLHYLKLSTEKGFTKSEMLYKKYHGQ